MTTTNIVKQTNPDPSEVQHLLRELAGEVLAHAAKRGAEQADVVLSQSQGFEVCVRLGEVEQVEHNRDKGVSVSVYFGQQKGTASSSDTRRSALLAAVDAACDIAKLTKPDPYAGLPAREALAFDYPALDLYIPWSLEVSEALDLARQCERFGLDYDAKITNSEGASLATHNSHYVYANSHGFCGGYASSRHNISCVLLAETAGEKQRDYEYTVARDREDLHTLQWVGEQAAIRTLGRLQARSIKSCQVPVIFAADIAAGLWSSFVAAISGSQQYRKSSFLLDSLQQQVFPAFINISEHPHLRKALGSAPFDHEGVATHERDLVSEGVVQSYVLSSYAARKLGMQTTGNAGGVHNLRIQHGELDLAALCDKMQTGLLITELMGHGINLTTGDFSQGAFGFWVEKGEIQYPVHEITVAGNLKEMFMDIIAVGSDVDKRGNVATGSVLIKQMTVAGK